jgi:nitric oxide dioxygenase
MLSDSQRAIVQSTVPLLEAGGEALTTHFYTAMIAQEPAVRPLFNPAHQASGAQPRALANGLLMYARHIDRLDQLGGLVELIVSKHVALQILPEHYPIVGRHLLAAIRTVLGAEIATDAVIEAWAAAYGQLADILIGIEERRYAELAQAEGGWRGKRAFRVVRKVAESEEITSFYLRPADGAALLSYEPGQFIGLRIVVDGRELRRNYSLSQAFDGVHYRISVKREAGGAVSNHLHDQVRENDTLDLYPPAGVFTLAQGERPVVLISGGVGITPTLAMLQAALKTQRPIHFIHAARHGGVHAFREFIDELAARHPQLKRYYCYDEARVQDAHADAVGRLDREKLAAWLPASRDVDAYYLGPAPFMRAVKRLLAELGVPEAQSRHEFFGPAEALA